MYTVLTNATIEQMIKANDIQMLIFDCDGTFMETLCLHYEAWKDAFNELGYRFIDKDEFIEKYAGISGNDMVKEVIKQFSYTINPANIIAKKRTIFIEKYIVTVKPIAKTLKIVNKYSKCLRMVVASGGAKEAVIKMLELNNMINLFQQVITFDDVKIGKPAPDIFLKASTDNNVPPNKCLVFEDHHAGFKAAQLAGMHYIDITQLE